MYTYIDSIPTLIEPYSRMLYITPPYTSLLADAQGSSEKAAQSTIEHIRLEKMLREKSKEIAASVRSVMLMKEVVSSIQDMGPVPERILGSLIARKT